MDVGVAEEGVVMAAVEVAVAAVEAVVSKMTGHPQRFARRVPSCILLKVRW